MNGGEQVSVRVVDDHPSMLAGVAAVLQSVPGIVVLGLHHSAQALLDEAGPHADVVLLDLHMGREKQYSTSWIPQLTGLGSRVLLYTTVETPAPLRAAVAAGAAGLCLKNDSIESLIDAVRQAAAGEFACSGSLAQALLQESHLMADLTEREVEVIRAIDNGLTHQQIASLLHIEPSTVKAHLKSIRRKYLELGRDITNAHSLAREARHEGHLPT